MTSLKRRRGGKVNYPRSSHRRRRLRLPNMTNRAAASMLIFIFAFVIASSAQNSYLKYGKEERGSLYSMEYRCYIKGSSGFLSPWHDIPLFADESNNVYNMVVEIPRWSNAKMEMITRDDLTPIGQDVKDGIVRFVSSLFPHHGYLWNYGALPQTWENASHIYPETNAKGDNDPIDVIEIGSSIHDTGSVIQVKVVGCLALIDSEETDWKLVVIDVTDADASIINSIQDVQKVKPGLAEATVKWFRNYKIPSGSPANRFAFDDWYKDVDFCRQKIAETNAFWLSLMQMSEPPLNTMSRRNVTAEAAAAIVAAAPPSKPASPLPATIQHWFFLSHAASQLSLCPVIVIATIFAS